VNTEPQNQPKSLAPAEAIARAEASRGQRTGESLAQYGHLLVAPETPHIVRVPEQKDAEVAAAVPVAEPKVDQPAH
jgi:hypothetical protein